MATFISKEELLNASKEIPAAMGASPPASPSPFGFGSGGTPIDQLERILTQVNNILSQVNTIRNNPTVKMAMGQTEGKTQEVIKMIESTPVKRPDLNAAGGSPAPAPQPPPTKIEIDAEGVKSVLADLFAELDKSADSTKLKTLGQLAEEYKNPLVRSFMDTVIIGKLQENLGRLIKKG